MKLARDERFRRPGLKETEAPQAPGAGLAGIEPGVERSLVSDAAMYAIATYAAQSLIFLGGIVQKGLLGPEATGYWALMGTAWSFFALASLGVTDGAIRQIPHYRGRGEFSAAASTANTAFTFSQLAFSGIGAAVICVSLAVGGGWAPELQWGLILLGLTAPLRNLVDCHEMLYQATKRFVPISAGLLVKAIVALTVQTLAVYLLGFYGMFVGIVALSVAALALYRRLGVSGPRNPAFRRFIGRERLSELIQVGIPLYVLGHAWVLFFAIDSLIVAGFVGVEELGYYALAVSITSYIVLLPKSIGATIFPRMQERFSASGDVARTRQYASDAQLVLAFMLVPPLIAAAYFLLPVLIRQALPAFEPAIAVVHIMVAGSFLIALVDTPVQLIITLGKRWNLSALMIGALALNAGANYFAVSVLDEGIEGAAYATVLSYVVLFVAVSAYGFTITSGWRDAARQLGAIFGIYAWTLAALWGLEALGGGGGGSLADDLAVNLLKLAVFCLLLTPWLLHVERRYRAFSSLRTTLASGRARLASLIRRQNARET